MSSLPSLPHSPTSTHVYCWRSVALSGTAQPRWLLPFLFLTRWLRSLLPLTIHICTYMTSFNSPSLAPILTQHALKSSWDPVSLFHNSQHSKPDNIYIYVCAFVFFSHNYLRSSPKRGSLMLYSPNLSKAWSIFVDWMKPLVEWNFLWGKQETQFNIRWVVGPNSFMMSSHPKIWWLGVIPSLSENQLVFLIIAFLLGGPSFFQPSKFRNSAIC